MSVCCYRDTSGVCTNWKITAHGFPLNDSQASKWFCITCSYKTQTPYVKSKIFSGYVFKKIANPNTSQTNMFAETIDDESKEDDDAGL